MAELLHLSVGNIMWIALPVTLSVCMCAYRPIHVLLPSVRSYSAAFSYSGIFEATVIIFIIICAVCSICTYYLGPMSGFTRSAFCVATVPA